MNRFEGGAVDGRGHCQHTLKNPINCTGIGLHSGQKVRMTLHPAELGTGICFRRVDLPGPDRDIPARWDTVSNTVMCTTIANEAGASVATIEHLMAALAGCGIDNALIEINGPEVPIMDGSSAPFVFLIECAGQLEQSAPRQLVRVLKRVEVGDADRSAALLPSDGFSVHFEIDFDSSAISHKSGRFDLSNGAFKHKICRARTFGFESDVQKLWDLGLARGGSLDNAVVVGDDDRILNDGGLRYDDEFVRHKVLDSVGDLYLAGGQLLAQFRGVRSGHALNHRLLQALFADETAWEMTTDVPRSVPLAPIQLPPRAVAASV